MPKKNAQNRPARRTSTRNNAARMAQRAGKPIGRISASEITKLIRQLAGMAKAGIPLIQSFEILSKEPDKKALKRLIQLLCQEVETGHSLTSALQKQPRYFDPLLCSLVDIGEQSGCLDSTLERAADYREKTETLRRRLKSALVYPVTVILIALAVTWLLMVKVVPQFEIMFQDFGATLPAFTRWVVNLSHLVKAYWLPTLSILTMLSILSGRLYSHNSRIKFRIDSIILKLPIIGTLIRKAILTRYARALAITCRTGTPLMNALTSIAAGAGNKVYEQAIGQVAAEVNSGQSLHSAMRESGVFPAMITQMVAIGEETGMLADMLDKAAEYYEADVESMTDNLTRLVEPVIMCVLGILTGGLILAMYLPVFNLGNIFGGGL